MRKILSVILVAFLALGISTALAEEDEKSREEKKAEELAAKRAEIDEVAKEALAQVLSENEKAKTAYEKAAGYAVFDNLRVTFIFTGGGGAGVAVNKATGERTYMKMGTGGIAIGIGAQKYQVIMLFETAEVLSKFIAQGWKAESGANAAAGQKGANIEAEFIDGIAIYQITESGLMASADISGTKYSVHKKLNKRE
jgi:lipid-binding SYLF domain-containing protein